MNLPDWFLCFVKILEDSFDIFINLHLSAVNSKRTPDTQSASHRVCVSHRMIYCYLLRVLHVLLLATRGPLQTRDGKEPKIMGSVQVL